MAPLLALFLFALAALPAFSTVRSLGRNKAGSLWWVGLALLLALGAAAGIWCGFFCEYHASDRLRVFSFPVPAVFFHLEDGRWVDFVTPAPLLVAVLNAMSVCLAAILPLSAVWIVYRVWKRAGSAAR